MPFKSISLLWFVIYLNLLQITNLLSWSIVRVDSQNLVSILLSQSLVFAEECIEHHVVVASLQHSVLTLRTVCLC